MGSPEDPAKADRLPDEFTSYVTSDKKTPIFGRLRAPGALRFWTHVLQVSTVVLTWITSGYPLPWIGGMAPDFGDMFMANKPGVAGPSSFGPREDFVDTAVGTLLVTGAIVKCERSDLRLISALNVVEQSDKLRLIIDQSFLSKHLEFDTFKFEDLRDVPWIFVQSDLLFSIDLMSAYHHVELHVSAWPYMGFS